MDELKTLKLRSKKVKPDKWINIRFNTTTEFREDLNAVYGIDLINKDEVLVETISSTNFEKVREFHETFNLLINKEPTVPDLRAVMLRMKLIAEEYKELRDEIDPFINSGGNEEINLALVAKELSDLLYVCYGMAVDFGIPIDDVFEEVHSSNMSKLDEDGKVIYNEFGKVMKSKLYRPADVKRVLTNKRK